MQCDSMQCDYQIVVRIPATLRDKIQEDATKQDRPTGYVVRQILTNYYNDAVQ